MATPAGYKPSPLGYGSPRSSPFRRPESPVSPSPLRQAAAPVSPYKGGVGTTPSGSRMMGGGSGSAAATPVPASGSWTPRNNPHTPLQAAAEIHGLSSSAGRRAADTRSPAAAAAAASSSSMLAQGAALSQLQPAQVRTLREGFQILDRDGDGLVGRDDVADMLNQLGLPASPPDIARFFPPSAPQTLAMGTFLNTLAAALAALSPSAELLAALAAFDEDDSGQIDVAELRDALLHTAPEPGEPALSEAEIHRVMQGFVGRRAFTTQTSVKNGSSGGNNNFGKRGEVFKYQEFVQSIAGSGQRAAGDEEAE